MMHVFRAEKMQGQDATQEAKPKLLPKMPPICAKGKLKVN